MMPSSAPTPVYEFEKVVLSVPGVQVNVELESRRLQDTNSTSNCTEVWVEEIRDRIDTAVRDVILQVEDLDVNLYNATTLLGPESVVLLFDVVIEIRSPVSGHSARRYIERPFDSESEKRLFVEFLRSTGCPEFANAKSIEIIVPQMNEQQAPEGNNGGGASVGLIAGLSIAIAAIAMLAATFIFLRVRGRKSLAESSDDEDLIMLSDGGSSRNGDNLYASEFGMRSGTEVSTLGDPIPQGLTPTKSDGSTIGSSSLDYDYQKAYVDMNSLVSGSLAESQTPTTSAPPSIDDPSNVFTVDDDTFSKYDSEEQFEIVAPPGLLGLILQSNTEDGRPTVHDVKPTSMLADVVRVGDHLISVDGQDVQLMRASDVSHLIAEKKDQDMRLLVFSRPGKDR